VSPNLAAPDEDIYSAFPGLAAFDRCLKQKTAGPLRSRFMVLHSRKLPTVADIAMKEDMATSAQAVQ
jgi:hypothetical protein